MRVLIADESPSFRAFLRHILELECDLSVVGEVADGKEAVQHARELKPDVVLMNIDLPSPDGLQAARHVKASLPATKVIMLSRVDGEAYRVAAFRHGANLFLPKGAPRGKSCLSSGAARKWGDMRGAGLREPILVRGFGSFSQDRGTNH